MQDNSSVKAVELSTYEMLTLAAKLPMMMRNAAHVGPTEYSALKSVLAKLQASQSGIGK